MIYLNHFRHHLRVCIQGLGTLKVHSGSACSYHCHHKKDILLWKVLFMAQPAFCMALQAVSWAHTLSLSAGKSSPFKGLLKCVSSLLSLSDNSSPGHLPSSCPLYSPGSSPQCLAWYRSHFKANCSKLATVVCLVFLDYDQKLSV